MYRFGAEVPGQEGCPMLSDAPTASTRSDKRIGARDRQHDRVGRFHDERPYARRASGTGTLNPQPAPVAGDFSVGAFALSVVWVSFSYSGWNAAVYIGSEIRDPDRNLPRAMLLGTVIVSAVYIALNTVFVYAAPVEQL